jgi:hypothetical protein
MNRSGIKVTIVACIVAAAIGALAAILAYQYVKFDATVQSDDGHAARDGDQHVDSDNHSDDSSSVSPIEARSPKRLPDRLPALPRFDSPLSEQLPALIERAEAGDPVSSCRLVLATTRCNEMVRQRNLTKRATRALQRGDPNNERLLVDLVASTEEQGADGLCDDVEIGKLPPQQATFAGAVLNMTPRQKTVMALMRSDGTIRRLHQGERYFSESGLYVVPQFLAENTRELLLAGYRAFDPLALEGLVLLHAPGTLLAPIGAGVWLPNPKLFLQYALLMSELYGPDALTSEAKMLVSSAASVLSQAELEQIRSIVHSEATRWQRFDVSRPPQSARAADMQARAQFELCDE